MSCIGGSLEEIDDHRQQGRSQQQLDNRLVELFEELLPERLARQRRELIGAEELPAADDVCAPQSLTEVAGVQPFLNLGDRPHATGLFVVRLNSMCRFTPRLYSSGRDGRPV